MKDVEICAPYELEAYAFNIARDEYAMFVFTMAQPGLPDALTAIEREIAHAVIEGLSNEAIASARGRSRHTIANQLRGIYRKLGVTGRNALIARCNQLAA